ncbi:MAG TPA: hypothetical protein VN670_08660, partial [Acidobacteriaceae bacterium]|nr:hypothetical protein [Acidobacteriaceae bacterium]
INQAVHTAQLHTEPVRLGVGYGEAFIGYDRRRIEADGTVSMFWNNSARIPTWPVDPTLTVLRIDRMDGQPLAILVNYSTHPVTFGPDNLRFSADFPGQMCKTVEQAFDGKPLAFFMQGAPGDINVYDTTTPVKEDAVGRRDWAGQTLGNAAVTTAKQIQTTVDPNPSIDFAEDMLPVKLRWDPEKFRQEAVREMSAETYKFYIGPIQETMQLPVTTVLINRKIAITGVPGEPFVQFQMSWRARCPVSSCIYLGYTNGYYGYFPTIKAATQGGYGAVNAITWTQVGTGERMLDHSVIEVYKMLGRFQDSPSADWKAVPPPAP